MPNIKSAIKRVKTSEKRRQLNTSQRSSMRSSIKALESAIAANDVEQAQAALTVAIKKLDKGAAKGIIHKNAVARKKSRLTKSVNAMSAEA